MAQMGVQDLASIGGALGLGSLLPWLWRKLSRNPKGEAETRKLNVEADDLIVERLYAEIERLDRSLGELRKQLEDERQACDRQIERMEGRIRQLQQRQTSAGNLAHNQVEGPLRTAFPVRDEDDRDDDLLRKLHRVPGTDGGIRK